MERLAADFIPTVMSRGFHAGVVFGIFGPALIGLAFHELRSLPGIGRYTAGAVMSFAHHQDAPVLDTNVARLLRRYFGLAATPRARTAELWSLAAAVIPKGKGYLINQALMDLGAMICRARAPRCHACPLRRSCDFRRNA